MSQVTSQGGPRVGETGAGARLAGGSRRMGRGVLVGLGLVCVGLGVLGIFVPGLPTTVFLLAASWLFARSSPRLQRWLLEHPRLGEPLRRLSETRSMTLRAKLLALASMWTAIAASCWMLAGAGLAARLVLIGLGLVGSGVILLWVGTLPAGAPAVAAEPRPPSSAG